MTPFTTLRAVAVPVLQPNLDTDQIIPARYLSRARGAGFADGLFHDLRFDAAGAERPGFVLEPGALPRRRDHRGRAQLLLRLLARACRLGAG